MLKQAISHALHLLGEVLLGAIALAGLAACALAWRLAQGPIDVTGLIQRQHPLFVAEGAHLTIGGAALAWEGFGAADRPLDVRLRDVSIASDTGSVLVHLSQARADLSIGKLLSGRLAPRSVRIDGAEVQLRATPDETPPAAPAAPASVDEAAALMNKLLEQARAITLPPWLSELRRVQIHDAAVTLHDSASGIEWRAPHAMLEANRLPDGGIAGQAHIDFSAGDVHTRLDAAAKVQPDGTHVTARLRAMSPADLARLSPALASLAPVDLPIGLALEARLDANLLPRQIRLSVTGGAGTVRAGTGQVSVQNAAATITLLPSELKLSGLRISLAPAARAARLSAPVITGSATATRLAGRIHVAFEVNIDSLNLADLATYWPPGTGGGSRPWLIQNVTAGRAHDAHVAGAIDTPADFSDVQLTSLTGGAVADDVTLFWLRPIPGLQHGRVRVTIENPDAMRISVDYAEQNRLRLDPGSFIHITGLSTRHQFGDIDVKLSGPLADALTLLNHPRLQLLARSQLQIIDPSGQAQAHLKLHVPLEEHVGMNDITIGATAALTGVHLGRVAGGYDLDQAMLALKVDGNGLNMTGDGIVAGIAARLGMDMDFRAGPRSQVLQHVTAFGTATPAQLAQAGLPAGAVRILTGGTAALSVDYTSRRNNLATLQLDADLGRTALATPFGWSKPVGPQAAIGAQVLLDHGHLAGVDHLYANGPGLSIDGQADIAAGHARGLKLQRLALGRTLAHGEIDFPGPSTPLRIALAGPMLDLSGYLDKQAPAPANPTAPKDMAAEDDDKPGQPWSADLHFDQVQLARAKTLSPFSLDAASDGRKILHGVLSAGAHDELSASITPQTGGRRLEIRAQEAGMVLRALGVADNLNGGKLQLDGTYDDALTAPKLTGNAILTGFDLRTAPAIGRLLQAMTLYGLADVLRGPGLHFSKLIAPFTWQRQVLNLTNARAFSPSLGLTAQGEIDLRQHTANVRGTVVPAYFFNQLLGNLPVVGRVFSPEKGGGVFAARYSVTGPLSDPKVGVNPLSALTPGFLREGFGLLSPKTQ